MTLAFLFSVILLVYHQITTIVPMYPWNDVKKYTRVEILQEASSNGSLMILASIYLFYKTYSFPKIYFPVLLAVEFYIWWIPYFLGKRTKRNRTAEVSKDTLKILPPIKNHPIPDCNHLVLHLLTLVTTLLVFLGGAS